MVGLDDIAIAGGLQLLKRNWKPLLLGGIGLATAIYIWILRGEVDDLSRDLKATTAERDAFKTSADNQAAGVKARDLTIARLNAQALLILKDWRDTRADAEKAKAATDSLAARYAAAATELEEKSHAEDADPAGLALDALDRLCREQGARTGTASGGC